MNKEETAAKLAEAKVRAAKMKAGPNTIVEDTSTPKKRNVIWQDVPASVKVEEARDLQPMNLRTFIAIEFGPRADQAAGFVHHAASLGPRTIHQWREALATFSQRPIK